MTSAPTDLRLVAPAAATWAVTVVGIVAGAMVAGVVGALAAVAALIAGVAARRCRPGRAAGIAVAVVATAGVSAGFGAAIAIRAAVVESSPLARDSIGHKSTVRMTITDDPVRIRGPGPARVRIAVRAGVVGAGSDGQSAVSRLVAATVTAPADGWDQVVPGQRLTAVVAVDEPYRRDLTAASLRASGLPRSVTAPPVHQRLAQNVRSTFAATVRRVLPPDESGLLPGLVLGDTASASDDVTDDFRTCGLTHLVAVSGANVALIGGAVLTLARVSGARRGVSVGIAMLALVCFVIVVRPSPSVVRAAVMGVIGMLAVLTRRDPQAVPALAAAVIAVLGIWPAMAVEPGFALSVGATAGLIVLGPRLREIAERAGLPRWAAETLAIAVAAQIATTPLIVMISGSFSVVGVVANVAVVPVVAPITVIGTLAALLAVPAPMVAELLVRFCGPLVWWMVRTADLLASVPLSAVHVPGGVAGAMVSGLLVSGLCVGLLWHHDRRDRSPASAPGRRRLPLRAGRRLDTRGTCRVRGIDTTGDPGARR